MPVRGSGLVVKGIGKSEGLEFRVKPYTDLGFRV